MVTNVQFWNCRTISFLINFSLYLTILSFSQWIFIFWNNKHIAKHHNQYLRYEYKIRGKVGLDLIPNGNCISSPSRWQTTKFVFNWKGFELCLLCGKYESIIRSIIYWNIFYPPVEKNMILIRYNYIDI